VYWYIGRFRGKGKFEYNYLLGSVQWTILEVLHVFFLLKLLAERKSNPTELPIIPMLRFVHRRHSRLPTSFTITS
jgi:hypothetical protein